MLTNFYTLSGSIETEVQGTPISTMVTFIAPLDHFKIDGQYITYGGVPIRPISLNPLNDELLGDMSYRSFLEKISDAQVALNELIIAENSDVSLMSLFNYLAHAEALRFKSLLISTTDAKELNNSITGLYIKLNELIEEFSEKAAN